MAAVMSPPLAKLTDVFSDLFVLGGYIRDSRELGPVDVLRARLLTLLQKAEIQGKALGYSQDSLTHARFAVVAFLDEMILSSPWASKHPGSAQSLRDNLYGEKVSGEGFFRHLDAIRSAPALNADLLDVFATCLMLGFEGKYKGHDRGTIRKMVEDLTRAIQTCRDVESLSPHGSRPEEVLELVKRSLPVWVVLVLGVGIVVFFYLGFSLLLSSEAKTVVEELTRLLEMAEP